MLTFVAFLFGMVGGLGSIISLMTDVLRSWNRIIVVIALFSLTAVALVIDVVIERWVRRSNPAKLDRRLAAAVTVAALLVVGIVDQTPATGSYEKLNAEFRAYDSYFGAIEASLAPGDWVVQLPYQRFPESHMSTGSDTNDVLIPYLHTETIAWTGGGIKGRDASDWTGELELAGAGGDPGHRRRGRSFWHSARPRRDDRSAPRHVAPDVHIPARRAAAKHRRSLRILVAR